MKSVRLILFGLLSVLGTTLLPLPSAAAAPGAPIVVNSPANFNDGACNAANCTLREAILAANGNPGLDTINFNIAGCPCTIAVVTSPLPEITDPVIINGYSQPGAIPNTSTSSNNAVLQIQLAGLTAPPDTNGLVISAGGSTVKGLNIVFFEGAAIWLKTNGDNSIQGNWLGIGLDGVSDFGNGNGIWLSHATSFNEIGGAVPAQHNLIAGNDFNGILLDDFGGSADRNSILGNIIGLDKNAANAVANQRGIQIKSKRNVIGQDNANARNKISGNSHDGISLLGLGARNNKILGNVIGKFLAGNGDSGILIWDGMKNKVGTATSRNFISYNGGAGIALRNPDTIRNSIRGNELHRNSGSGIDLGDDGVTLNDAGDGDGGPNLRQNFPILRRPNASANRVKGRLKSASNAQYIIDLYVNTTCDGSGYGEGSYLESFNVTTAADGVARFSVVLSEDFVAGEVFTATATDAKGNTSEFSKCKIAQ